MIFRADVGKRRKRFLPLSGENRLIHPSFHPISHATRRNAAHLYGAMTKVNIMPKLQRLIFAQ
jgi:hypothetical protein